MLSSVSLPPVIIFERHWDTIPKQLIRNLLPKLLEEGYDTLCFEYPQDQTEEQIVLACNNLLKYESNLHSQAEKLLKQARILENPSKMGHIKLCKFLNLYFYREECINQAERIKNFPATQLVKEIFNDAKKHFITIKGIDINVKNYVEMISPSIEERISSIDRTENDRIKTLSENFLKLYNQQKGIVFICGALHAVNLMAKFKEDGLYDRILYYFPHSEKFYDDSINEIQELFMNNTLKDHTYCLIKENDIHSLSSIIVEEVKKRNRDYQEEVVEGNSHSKLLAEIFNVSVKTFKRPGYYVDALIETNQITDKEEMIKKLHEKNIQTHLTCLNSHSYLIIPEVNTKRVAENIRRLK